MIELEGTKVDRDILRVYCISPGKDNEETITSVKDRLDNSDQSSW